MQKSNYRCLCLTLAAGVFLILSAAAIHADQQLKTEEIFALMQEKGYRCQECHTVDEKIVGPSWKEVSKRRKSNKWATSLLTFKISAGSIGEYEEVAVPHNACSEEDAQAIAGWILSLSNDKEVGSGEGTHSVVSTRDAY